MSDSWNWFNSYGNKNVNLIRKLLDKAIEMGRLPTVNEINADPKVPNSYEYSIAFGDMSDPLKTVAMYLYGSAQRKSPMDLVGNERKLSEDEQKRLKEKLWAEYLERVEKLKEPGYLERRMSGYRKPLPLEDAKNVTKIPTSQRLRLKDYEKGRNVGPETRSWKEVSRDSYAATGRPQKVEHNSDEDATEVARGTRGGLTAPSEAAKAVRAPTVRLEGVPVDAEVSPEIGGVLVQQAIAKAVEQVVKTVQKTVTGVAADSNIDDMERASDAKQVSSAVEVDESGWPIKPDYSVRLEEGSDMPKKLYSFNDAKAAMLKAIDHYGGIPTMAQYTEFASDNKLPCMPIISRLLGPKATWPAKLGLEERPGSDGAEAAESVAGETGETSDLASPSEAKREASDLVLSSETKPVMVIKMNVSGKVLVEMQISGQDYRVEVNLGAGEQ